MTKECCGVVGMWSLIPAELEGVLTNRDGGLQAVRAAVALEQLQQRFRPPPQARLRRPAVLPC